MLANKLYLLAHLSWPSVIANHRVQCKAGAHSTTCIASISYPIYLYTCVLGWCKVAVRRRGCGFSPSEQWERSEGFWRMSEIIDRVFPNPISSARIPPLGVCLSRHSNQARALCWCWNRVAVTADGCGARVSAPGHVSRDLGEGV